MTYLMNTEQLCTRVVGAYLHSGAPILPTMDRFDGTSLPFAGSWASRKQRMFFDRVPGSASPGSSG